MKKGNIEFKGIKEGIYLIIKEGNFDDIVNEIDNILYESKDFFKGAKIVGIKSEILSEFEKNEILNIIKYRHRLEINNDNLSEDIKELLKIKKVTEATEEQVENLEEEIYSGIDMGETIFLNSTIRSGQLIEFEGNIVIIGDVNPGAIIKAKGNIVILGSLKGIAHAGDNGNKKAIIAAYDLSATQLRIANKIGRKPDEEIEKKSIPEIARIENDEIYIEPYLARK